MGDKLYVEHRNSRSAKQKKGWYSDLATYMLGQIDMSHVTAIEDRRNAIDGEISDTYYKKVLNPFNATDPKFTRFRAEMRNYDLMKDVIRRYMGEFAKQPFDFQVKANDADVITRFNAEYNKQLAELAVQYYINMLNQQGANTGQASKEVPDFQAFFDKFKKNYVDKTAAQGQKLLTAIIDWTESKLKYYKAFYDYVVLGQTYTYRDVRNGQIYKEIIDPTNYYPISNGQGFVEDHNNGVRGFRVTVPELLENFGDVIDTDTYNKIKDLFDKYRSSDGSVKVPLSHFESRLTGEQYATFTKNATGSKLIEDNVYRFTNKDAMVDGHHFVFTTEVKVGILVYQDPVTGQLAEELIEADTFKLDKRKGHVSIEWNWWNEVWEFYMFGNEQDDIFTVPRPIAYQRRDANNPQKVKLPYNGITEVIPGTLFTFSIPDAILPFQIARNIFAFYREKIIAKNKDKILVVPESLWGDIGTHDDKLYRLEANSTFTYDDSDDDSGQKAAAIRVLDASLSQFIGHITELMDRMRDEAWDTVDMNPQRYGDIQTSAGKGTTEEAIVRSSMGSVIIFTMFEKLLEKEYLADLEYSKAAYIDGKQGSYTDLDGNSQFLDLDINKHVLANYGLHVVSSVAQAEKKRKLENLALSAGQNGEFGLAINSIINDNVASIVLAFEEFEEANKQYQASIANEKQQIEAQTAQQVEATAQADRASKEKIAEMQEAGDMQRAIMDAKIKLLELESTLATASVGEGEGEGGEDSAANDAYINSMKERIEAEKMNLARRQQAFNERKQSEDTAVKREDIASKERIAKANKNQYDTK